MNKLPTKLDMNRPFESSNMHKWRKKDVLLCCLHLCIGGDFWLTKDMGCIPIVLLISYEVMLFVIFAVKKFKIGIWALVLPASSIMVPINYVFYDDITTLRWVSWILPMVAIIMSILIWIYYVHMHGKCSYWVTNLVVIIVVAAGILGQFVQINDAFLRSEVKQSCSIEETRVLESSRPFSTVYYISISLEDGFSDEIAIPKRVYSNIKKGDSFTLTTYEGCFGIRYLKKVPKEIETSLKERES